MEDRCERSPSLLGNERISGTNRQALQQLSEARSDTAVSAVRDGDRQAGVGSWTLLPEGSGSSLGQPPEVLDFVYKTARADSAHIPQVSKCLGPSAGCKPHCLAHKAKSMKSLKLTVILQEVFTQLRESVNLELAAKSNGDFRVKDCQAGIVPGKPPKPSPAAGMHLDLNMTLVVLHSAWHESMQIQMQESAYARMLLRSAVWALLHTVASLADFSYSPD